MLSSKALEKLKHIELDISHNALEDKDLLKLSGLIIKRPKSIRGLDISKASGVRPAQQGWGGVGLSALFTALGESREIVWLRIRNGFRNPDEACMDTLRQMLTTNTSLTSIELRHFHYADVAVGIGLCVNKSLRSLDMHGSVWDHQVDH